LSDNGSGFDTAAETGGYGLAGMRDRLALVGGTLDVESSDEGTTLLITLPREGTA
jgi:signal transduction histidine kinase